jgi:hypothetical protein
MAPIMPFRSFALILRPDVFASYRLSSQLSYDGSSTRCSKVLFDRVSLFPNSAEISDTALAALQEGDDAWQPTVREISEETLIIAPTLRGPLKSATSSVFDDKLGQVRKLIPSNSASRDSLIGERDSMR